MVSINSETVMDKFKRQKQNKYITLIFTIYINS